MENEIQRYNIHYRKYNIFKNDYVNYIKVVYTKDVYHEIGKMICTSLEAIQKISYTKPRATVEECEKFWLSNGYRKLDNNLYIEEC